MYSISIVTRAPFGLRGVPIDPDGNLIMRYSSLIKRNLLERLRENNIQCEVAVNNYVGDLTELKRDGASLILLSPYIKSYVDLSGLNEEDYYFINEDDFLNGNTDRIMSVLDKLSWATVG